MTELEYLKKYIHPEDNLDEAIKRLEAGEPVQYIIGDVAFYDTILEVNKNVLIPRPETEELVEKYLKLISRYYPTQEIKILDIGTGSGCIAITLKKHLTNALVSACDISPEALKVASKNAQKNNTDVTFIQSDIFSNINDQYDIIISNPPYIKYDEEIMDIVKNNEPHLALYAKNNGLYFYQEILSNARNYLSDKNIIIFEIGETQADDITKFAKIHFPSSKIIVEQDFRHLDRYVFIINE